LVAEGGDAVRTDSGGVLVRFGFRETGGSFRGAEDLEGFEESREGDLEGWRFRRVVDVRGRGIAAEGGEESFV